MHARQVACHGMHARQVAWHAMHASQEAWHAMHATARLCTLKSGGPPKLTTTRRCQWWDLYKCQNKHSILQNFRIQHDLLFESVFFEQQREAAGKIRNAPRSVHGVPSQLTFPSSPFLLPCPRRALTFKFQELDPPPFVPIFISNGTPTHFPIYAYQS